MRTVGSRDGLELGKSGSVLVTGPTWEEPGAGGHGQSLEPSP